VAKVGPNERQLAVLALLRRNREPLSFERLRSDLPGAWGGSRQAARRKFERDKKALAELGVVLRYDQRMGGYALDRRDLELRPVGLTRAQAALARQAAALVAEDRASPFAPEVRGAFFRLWSVDEPTDPEEPVAQDLVFHHPTRDRDPDLPDRLGRLALAAWRRLPVRFHYRRWPTASPLHRALEPWGLYACRGFWYVVGQCPDAGARRTYAVARISEVRVEGMPDGRPRFDRPADFDLRQAAARKPWDFELHDPVDVTIRADAEVAANVARVLDETEPVDDVEVPGTALITRRVSWSQPLLEALREWLPRVDVLAPEGVRQEWRAPLDAIASRHIGEVAP
jgi:predicted DNA-binding transcriptional regulator YafY